MKWENGKPKTLDICCPICGSFSDCKNRISGNSFIDKPHRERVIAARAIREANKKRKG
jgi:hypothetical protein